MNSPTFEVLSHYFLSAFVSFEYVCVRFCGGIDKAYLFQNLRDCGFVDFNKLLCGICQDEANYTWSAALGKRIKPTCSLFRSLSNC